jgi:hypothetical protein
MAVAPAPPKFSAIVISAGEELVKRVRQPSMVVIQMLRRLESRAGIGVVFINLKSCYPESAVGLNGNFP